MISHPWYVPAGSTGDGTSSVVIDAKRAGWAYCGLTVLTLPDGGITFTTGETEQAVLPLSGPVTVEVEGHRFALAGRDSVFSAVTDWAYLPLDAEVRLSGPGSEVALPSAVATGRFDPMMIPAADVSIEVRGAGGATRQVTNFMSPEAFDGADKLMCVELLTPSGNWSSYPPHRHDADCPVNNEEIYYFRVGRDGTTTYEPAGFGLHRTYTDDGEVDLDLHVTDGDVFLVHRGYHGPCVAAPGYPLYYLNVLAGPGAERSMAFCDDPTHHWVRESWVGMPTDPRCPMTGPTGLHMAAT